MEEFFEREVNIYPVVFMPFSFLEEPQSFLGIEISHKPMPTRFRKTGWAENYFKEFLRNRFGDDILVNYELSRNGNYMPKFPDFIYVRRRTNLFIAIEIDEPYVLNTGELIHCIDMKSNEKYYTDNNWFVIRFSEQQVVTEPEKCCLFIRNIASYLESKIYDYPDAHFMSTDHPQKVERWDRKRALNLLLDNHRGKYLQSISNDVGVHLNRSFDINQINVFESDYEIWKSLGKEWKHLINEAVLFKSKNTINEPTEREMKYILSLTSINIYGPSEWFIYKELANHGDFLRDLSGLTLFKNLETARVFDEKLVDLNISCKLPKLKKLQIFRSELVRLNGITNFPNLMKLDVELNRIKEISDLESNSFIESVILDGNPVEKLKGLEGLSDLKNLSITNCVNIREDDVLNLQNKFRNLILRRKIF